MLTMEMLIISYVFLFFASLVIYIICHLSIVVLKTRKEIGRLQNDSTREENLKYYIAKQRSYFLIWLTFLKLIGICLLVLLTLRITMEIVSYFRDIIITDSAFDLSIFAYGAEAFIITHEFFLILTIFPWFIYIIFMFILERRIIKLRIMKRK